jgi:hypothetical protein
MGKSLLNFKYIGDKVGGGQWGVVGGWVGKDSKSGKKKNETGCGAARK